MSEINPIVFLFSGQGSQYYQMGKDLYQNSSVYREWMERMDQKVFDYTNFSVLSELFHPAKSAKEPFSHLPQTSAAIFMVQYALTELLRTEAIRPHYVIGGSLGEFVAAAVAGICDWESTLEMILTKADLTMKYVPPGGMLAVLADSSLFNETPELHAYSEIASTSHDSHFVVASKESAMIRIKQWLEERDISYFDLPVTYGFHSSAIDSLRLPFLAALNGREFKPAQIPLVSCVDGKTKGVLNAEHFWRVIRRPVAFDLALENLRHEKEALYIDIGPAGTMAAFTKKILRENVPRVATIITPFGKAERAIDQLKKNYFKPVNRNQRGKKMLTIMFPGQGSQQKGMGGDLFDRFEHLTAQASDILGYSIKELCLRDADGKLSKTQFTQPAIFTASALAWLAKVADENLHPDFLAGHSLGEYNALFAAGVFDFATGLRLVQKRGEIMGRSRGGSMGAVLGIKEADIRRLLTDNDLHRIDIANFNSPGQIVIAGPDEDLARAREVFTPAQRARFIPLPVSAAFHSRYMNAARDEFTGFLSEFKFHPPKIPVIANVSARPYEANDTKKLLSEQITSSVRWTATLSFLMEQGEMQFLELGPGSVLMRLLAETKAEEKSRMAAVPISEPNQTTQPRTPKAEIAAPPSRYEEDETTTITVKSSVENPPTLQELKPADLHITQRVEISPEELGSTAFKRDYRLKYAYYAGGMYRAIASKELVVSMGKAGLLSFFGSGGLALDSIEAAIQFIKNELGASGIYGMNLLNNLSDPALEEAIIDLYIQHDVTIVEAAAYMQASPALVRYRALGLTEYNGLPLIKNRVIAKLSRPEIAAIFLAPPPQKILDELRSSGKITAREHALAARIPLADDITVEADSGGHTDRGLPYVLMPAMLRLRDEAMQKYGYAKSIRIGAAGGIGTPEAAAAALILGADYLVTGSINQATVEAATSDEVKNILQGIEVQDTDYAPAGDMFELGAKVQVVKKGLFFAARGNKLYNLYMQYGSLDEIDARSRQQLEEKYFKRTIAEVWQETSDYLARIAPREIEKAERNPKYKMALVFKWYFARSTRLALEGDLTSRIDYQIQCGPALGAFNQWVVGTELQDWRNRHVDKIAEVLMKATADLMSARLNTYLGSKASAGQA